MSEGNGGAPRFIDLLIAGSSMERHKFTILGQEMYFRPLTRKQMIDSWPKDGMQREPDYEGLFMLVATAEAEDGSKLFRMEDIEALRTKVNLDLLQRIESAMLGAVRPSLKEAGAILAANPPSITG